MKDVLAWTESVITFTKKGSMLAMLPCFLTGNKFVRIIDLPEVTDDDAALAIPGALCWSIDVLPCTSMMVLVLSSSSDIAEMWFFCARCVFSASDLWWICQNSPQKQHL